MPYADPHIDARAIRDAWGKYVSRYDWHFFFTGTARFTNTPEMLFMHFEQKLVRDAARRTQGPVAWFAVVEHGPDKRPHLHALIWTRGSITTHDLMRGWKLGRSEAEIYCRERGAAYYVTKSISPTSDAYDVSRRLPPLLGSPVAA